jgi:hypothetical protein
LDFEQIVARLLHAAVLCHAHLTLAALTEVFQARIVEIFVDLQLPHTSVALTLARLKNSFNFLQDCSKTRAVAKLYFVHNGC